MEIQVLYKNGVVDTFSTESLTENDSLHDGESKKSVMTKFHLNCAEFLDEAMPCNLNIYIYYYRKHGEKNSVITNKQYLDKCLFYDNDLPVFADMSPEMIKMKDKGLPYGAMEPGSWFNLIPYELIDEVLQVKIDDKIIIYRSYKYECLVNLSKFYYLEQIYNPDFSEKTPIELRINDLVKIIKDFHTQIPMNEYLSDIGFPDSIANYIAYK